MYMYIMERTQIYLNREQAEALDREARRRGTTRSHLIREAIDAQYGSATDEEQVKQVLEATAGLWEDRAESGTEYVERMRSGGRLDELYRTDDA